MEFLLTAQVRVLQKQDEAIFDKGISGYCQ